MKLNNLAPPFSIAFSPRFLPILVRDRSLCEFLRANDMTLNRRHDTGGIATHAEGHFVVFSLESLSVALPGVKIRKKKVRK